MKKRLNLSAGPDDLTLGNTLAFIGACRLLNKLPKTVTEDDVPELASASGMSVRKVQKCLAERDRFLR